MNFEDMPNQEKYELFIDKGREYLAQAGELCVGTGDERIVLSKDAIEACPDALFIIGILQNHIIAQGEYIQGQQDKMLQLSQNVRHLSKELASYAGKLKGDGIPFQLPGDRTPRAN